MVIVLQNVFELVSFSVCSEITGPLLAGVGLTDGNINLKRNRHVIKLQKVMFSWEASKNKLTATTTTKTTTSTATTTTTKLWTRVCEQSIKIVADGPGCAL